MNQQQIWTACACLCVPALVAHHFHKPFVPHPAGFIVAHRPPALHLVHHRHRRLHLTPIVARPQRHCHCMPIVAGDLHDVPVDEPLHMDVALVDGDYPIVPPIGHYILPPPPFRPGIPVGSVIRQVVDCCGGGGGMPPPIGGGGTHMPSPVPEPATWGLMTLALAVTGWALRRKEAVTCL